jgi:hypothetical protein
MRHKVRFLSRGWLVASALLSLATLWFWVQSFLWSDQIDSMSRGCTEGDNQYAWYSSFEIKSNRGGLSLQYHHDTQSDPRLWRIILMDPLYRPRFSWNSGDPVAEPPIIPAKHTHLGFGLQRDKTSTLLMMPDAALALPVLAWFVVTLYFFRRVKFPRGCCQRCGYDLRFARTRCPECGRRAPRRRWAGDRLEPWMAFLRRSQPRH